MIFQVYMGGGILNGSKVLTQLQQIRHKKGGKRAKIRQVKVVTH